MSEIWIVQGSTGEYSDHKEWPVKAFRDKGKAQRLVIEAQARCNEIATVKNEYEWDVWWDMTEAKHATTVNEFDPAMKLDYTGTHYTCYPIELED